jgi:hypothetical protein
VPSRALQTAQLVEATPRKIFGRVLYAMVGKGNTWDGFTHNEVFFTASSRAAAVINLMLSSA